MIETKYLWRVENKNAEHDVTYYILTDERDGTTAQKNAIEMSGLRGIQKASVSYMGIAYHLVKG